MKSQWINTIPGIVFSLYAGPLSDRLGRKPLMLFPILGHAVSAACGLVNVVFLVSI
jgi:MFS family permease